MSKTENKIPLNKIDTCKMIKTFPVYRSIALRMYQSRPNVELFCWEIIFSTKNHYIFVMVEND